MEIQEYTSGSGNWTVPAGVYLCDVLLVGGGGGGYATGENSGAGGGGGIVLATEYPVLPGDTLAYAVGTGGATGADGVDTTFGNVLVASGGKTGASSTGGEGGAAMGTAGGAADTDSPYTAKGKAYFGEVGGAGAGDINNDAGANSPFASGGAGGIYGGGGGASWGDGGTHETAAAANTGGGGGSHSAGGSGYIRITWGVDLAVTVSELATVPASTGSIKTMIQFIFEKMRHKGTMNKNTGVETLFKDDGSTPLGTATHSDDGTTVTKAEMT